MVRRHSGVVRHGTTAVELAVVLPVVLLLIFGLMIGSLGVFYSNQVAYLATETARFASAHGSEYMTENAAAITAGNLPTVDYAYLRDNVAKPRATALDTSQVGVAVTIDTASGNYLWNDTTNNKNRALTSSVTSGGVTTVVNNTVTVTVTYQWRPLMYITGPITLTSTCLLPMNY
jgi:Flp pilus assembly protein TadG